MEKAIIHGRACVKRGKFWFAIKRPLTTVDYWARRNAVRGNWNDFDNVQLGNNRVIVNQRS